MNCLSPVSIPLRIRWTLPLMHLLFISSWCELRKMWKNHTVTICLCRIHVSIRVFQFSWHCQFKTVFIGGSYLYSLQISRGGPFIWKKQTLFSLGNWKKNQIFYNNFVSCDVCTYFTVHRQAKNWSKGIFKTSEEALWILYKISRCKEYL